MAQETIKPEIAVVPTEQPSRRKLPRGWLIAIIATGCVLALLIGAVVIVQPWVPAASFEPEIRQADPMSLTVGESALLSIDIEDGAVVSYESLEPLIAEVDDTGQITALDVGDAVIRATVTVENEPSSGLRAWLRDVLGIEPRRPTGEPYILYYVDTPVTVTLPEVEIIDVGAFDIKVGDTAQLTLTPTDIAPIITVTCDNPEMVAVTATGDLTALTEGTATVTVLYSKAVGNAAIPVHGERYTVTIIKAGNGGTDPPPDPAKPPVVTSVVFTTTPPASIQQGGSATVKAEARGTNNPNKAVTYKLDRTVSGVSISSAGVVSVSGSASVGAKFKIIATSAANTAVSATSAEISVIAKSVQPPSPVVTSVVFITNAPTNIQQGGSATVKAEARGTNNPNAAVTYKLDRAVAGVSVNASGVITVTGSATVGATFRIVATSTANTSVSAMSGEIEVTSSRQYPLPTVDELNYFIEKEIIPYCKRKGMGINDSFTISNANYDPPAGTRPWRSWQEVKDGVYSRVDAVYARAIASPRWYEGAPIIRVVWEQQPDGEYWIYVLYG